MATRGASRLSRLGHSHSGEELPQISTTLETKTQLKFQAPVAGVAGKRAHAPGDLVGLPEERRVDVANDRARIDVVEKIARRDGGGKAVAAVRKHRRPAPAAVVAESTDASAWAGRPRCGGRALRHRRPRDPRASEHARCANCRIPMSARTQIDAEQTGASAEIARQNLFRPATGSDPAGRTAVCDEPRLDRGRRRCRAARSRRVSPYTSWLVMMLNGAPVGRDQRAEPQVPGCGNACRRAIARCRISWKQARIRR